MIVYLNGQLVPADQARVSVFDRGFLFGDGVYEGLRVFDGVPMSAHRHTRRMRAGLAEARIGWDASALGSIADDVCRANGLPDAFVYAQVTRGRPGPGQPLRSRTLAGDCQPTVFAYASAQPPLDSYAEPPTARLALVPDTRWQRGHLKSVSLLGNVLAAYDAGERDADEAAMHRDGVLTEACASNLIIVRGGRAVTPSLDSAAILEGVTRARCLELAPEIEQRPVAVGELHAADEVVLVGTTSIVTSAVRLDGRAVGEGRPGPFARRLLGLVMDDCRRQVEAAHARTHAHAG